MYKLLTRRSVIFALVAVVYLLGSSLKTFWAENEAYYALGAESLLKNPALVPTIYNETLADKPPFMFWWVAVVSWFFGGVSEFSARLANLLPSLLLVAGIMAFARAYLSFRSSVLAGLVLATSYEFWKIAMEINTDMMLTAMLFVAWSAMFTIFERGFRWKHWGLLWGAVAIGVLTKGPVAAVLTAMVGVLYVAYRFGLRAAFGRLLTLRPFTGSVVALAPFALWCLLVYRTYGFGPLDTILLKHNVQRFVDAFDHQQPWYYYFHEILTSLLPWSLVIPFMAVLLYKVRPARRSLQPWQIFSLVIIVTVFGFFSLSTSKRGYYLLPLIPWAVLLLTYALRVCLRYYKHLLPRQAQKLPAARISAMGAYGMLLVMGLYFIVAFPVMDQRRSAKGLISLLESETDEFDRLVLYAEEDPRIMYYLNEGFRFVDNTDAGNQELVQLIADASQPDQYDIDLMVPDYALKKLTKLTSTDLYIDGSGFYRGDKFYVLTTEIKPSLPRLANYVANLKQKS